jgi:hypothetical protein
MVHIIFPHVCHNNEDIGRFKRHFHQRPQAICSAAFTHHIDELRRRRFVYIDYSSIGDDTVRLLPDGAKWLLEHDQMPPDWLLT